jgi:hypothetical protein
MEPNQVGNGTIDVFIVTCYHPQYEENEEVSRMPWFLKDL